MVLAHVTDAWTWEADRHDLRYFAAVFVNGLAAPMFMMLAGVALALAAERRARAVGMVEASRLARRRGWQVFGLAFLFRAQSQLLGWGPIVNFFKVDILNVMGLSMIGTAWLWRAGSTRRRRIVLFACATAFFALLNPIVRGLAWLAPVPDVLELYLRSIPGRTSFSLFPWAGFVTAGALAGELIDAAGTPAEERRLQPWLALTALGGVGLSYALSLLPSPYAQSTFWSTSPAFFFIRLGLVVAVIPLAWRLQPSWEPLVTMGRSSLFVYWIHVEMVYGGPAVLISRSLPWEMSVIASAALCGLLYRIVLVKNAWLAGRSLPRRLEFLAPVLR